MNAGDIPSSFVLASRGLSQRLETENKGTMLKLHFYYIFGWKVEVLLKGTVNIFRTPVAVINLFN
jgi:hypothetical protein